MVPIAIVLWSLSSGAAALRRSDEDVDLNVSVSDSGFGFGFGQLPVYEEIMKVGEDQKKEAEEKAKKTMGDLVNMMDGGEKQSIGLEDEVSKFWESDGQFVDLVQILWCRKPKEECAKTYDERMKQAGVRVGTHLLGVDFLYYGWESGDMLKAVLSKLSGRG
eukprot:TRINITY_DN4483_c0_g1_i1.p1 TRINITY_DN4483_c0_g1~~TRINITY_DN4483_c0_g1_i1.p1  ORF type:complete len:162 (-),score=39.92 TRINITY_DN4483_c0_g1_i1:105-590(-)